ncbi:hypothetical protein GYO_4299 [Bacillus spizizenii TU-B-10]|uniref:Uncharacterized protein n=1 Tax=Bacillus spizizenii (strain DSM 15029 / JCM 12233 / NBRC 101239 / NRRL B-23049 / TU-B-10) TaxID=1052585 RepID=G4NYG5_BACS4|nr:hypothetical protein GYO_4299 [Bacillus spizizenii TU-B-10]
MNDQISASSARTQCSKGFSTILFETAVAGYHRASPSTSLDKVHLHIQILIILILLLLDQLSTPF